MDQTQDLKNLIISLELSEADKQALLDQLTKEGASESLFGKIKTHIEQTGQQVKANLDAIAAEQKKITDEYSKKMADEYASFEQEMKPIEEEIGQIAKDAEAELDQIDIEDARQKIAGT